MTDDLTVLRQKNAAEADFIQVWRNKYQRKFDFSIEKDKADFYEGLLELAKHIPIGSSVAAVNISASTDGISGLSVGIA